jgi:hypothetical protein
MGVIRRLSPRQIVGLWVGFLILFAVLDRPVSANPAVIETIHERAAAHGQSGPYLVAVARCESRLDPGAVGGQGEVGLFQLHPRGLLRDFYARGYSDPWSAWQQADYVASAFSRGLAGHWSCA